MIVLNRSKQPEIKPIDKINFFQPEVKRLSNGIPVYQINTGTQDVIRIEFIFNAGNWYQDKHLISHFTNKMLKEGTKKYTSKEIAEKIDYYGAHLESSADMDMAYVSLYSLNKYISHILPILEEVIMHPVFPENELKTKVQNQKQKFIVNSKKVSYLARRKFNELIFGEGHPYGKLYNADDFDKIDKSGLIKFHNNHYLYQNYKIIISGKIPAELIELLDKHFGRYNGGSDSLNSKQIISETPCINRFVHVKRDDTVQSAIRIGKMLFNKKHPDYKKLKVLNTVLGGYFGSRLMTNIREDKGYTYGIGSALVSLQHSGYFFIASEIGSEVTQKAIEEVYHEIRVLQEDKIPEAELGIVRNYMLGSLLSSIDGAFAQADNFKSLLEYGLNFNYYKDFIEIINNISAEELRGLAQKYFNLDSLFELKVGR
jgi:predicted Zn-dependent peptidase